MSRWLFFLIAVLIGAAAGLYYGWRIDPVEYIDTSPDTLRVDYKADYVLMVAEAYQSEKDLKLASSRLGLLGNEVPSQVVTQAILFAEKQRYSESDLSLMRALAKDLMGPPAAGPRSTP